MQPGSSPRIALDFLPIFPAIINPLSVAPTPEKKRPADQLNPGRFRRSHLLFPFRVPSDYRIQAAKTPPQLEPFLSFHRFQELPVYAASILQGSPTLGPGARGVPR